MPANANRADNQLSFFNNITQDGNFFIHTCSISDSGYIKCSEAVCFQMNIFANPHTEQTQYQWKKRCSGKIIKVKRLNEVLDKPPANIIHAPEPVSSGFYPSQHKPF